MTDAPCGPVKSATTLPLATANQRLRGWLGPDVPGRSPLVTILVTAVNASGRKCAPCRLVRRHGRRILRPVLPGPRWLTRQQAAEYLNLSLDMLDRLTQQGELPRVQLALGNRNVRKVLYDRADLDRLIELNRIV